ncbi:hypothetical protein X797_002250 [Metarhizium robertsii]|uniref:Uncharacterized protein n=1 Tax=Metarhizium robertsii TaxID=568076 RepID=A0A0A1V322_9HYPO|nr:hypothetical protein X797_002250 [Metarhizium robertsii]
MGLFLAGYYHFEELGGKGSHRASHDETAPDGICPPSPDLPYPFGIIDTQNTNIMYNGINPTKSTDKNRTSLGEGAGLILIGLNQRPAGHPRFPQSPGPPPSGPLPDRPTPRSKTAPEHAQGRTLQAQTIQEGSQGLVRKVLDTTFDQVGKDLIVRRSLYKSEGKRGIDKNTGRPYETAVKALSEALERCHLSEEEENAVFEHLTWPFFCQECKEYKPACEFVSCSRRFWAIEPKGCVFLHGEKCMPCEEKEHSPL